MKPKSRNLLALLIAILVLVGVYFWGKGITDQGGQSAGTEISHQRSTIEAQVSETLTVQH